MGKTVLLVGLGEVGYWTLEFLARRPEVTKIVTADANQEVGLFKTQSAMVSAALEGRDTRFDFRLLDLNDVEGTARLIDVVKPDVVFSSVTMNSWWVLQPIPIPQQTYDRLLKAGFGFLVPWHVRLVAKLAQAMQKAGSEAVLVNASFPDVVNCLVKNYHGFDRIVGIGNIDLLAGELKVRASLAENVPPSEVVVYLVGSHAIGDHASEGVPFQAKILVGDVDICSKYDVGEWLAHPLAQFDSEVGRRLHLYSATAASAVKDLVAILEDSNQLTHVPGPGGVLGGFPVRLSAQGAKISLPQGVDYDEAVATNAAACKWDGIEKIDADGTLYYTDECVGILNEFGYNCPVLHYDDLSERAAELLELVPRWLRAQ